jgi:hypothetical protein
MAGDLGGQGGAEVLSQGLERAPRPPRTGWSGPGRRGRQMVLAAVIVLLAAGAYVRYEVTGPRLPSVAVQISAGPKTAWQPGVSGRPTGPVELEFDVRFLPVRTKGVVTLLGMSGPGITDGRAAPLRLSATGPTVGTLSTAIDCPKVHLPVQSHDYGLRLRVVDGSRRVEGTVPPGALAATWDSTIDMACGSWLARQSLTVLGATATVDPLKPSADLKLLVINGGDHKVNLGLTTGYSVLDVSARTIGDLVVPARGRAEVPLHVDVTACDAIPTPPAVSGSGTVTNSADYLGLVALVGGRPTGPATLSPQPLPDGLAPTGIVMTDAAATAVAGALHEVCGNLNVFVTLIDPTGFAFDRKHGLLTVRIQIDGTPGKVSDLGLVSDGAPAGDATAFTPLWTSIAHLVPDRNGQVTTTLQYSAPAQQSPCPSNGAYLPGFQIVAHVPVAGGVRTVEYGQFVDLTTVPEVMAQLCPA